MHWTRIRVEREMDFMPGAPLRIAVLAHLPFTLAIDLQTGAVDNQMDRFVVAKDRQFDIKRFARRQSVVSFGTGKLGKVKSRRLWVKPCRARATSVDRRSLR
ncbi:MAG: hypothetical protein E5299_01596 [Burkholderia gladioli]|nr:MAG: hypothetical protein E5299_01596 [Burkholderia gladioli]